MAALTYDDLRAGCGQSATVFGIHVPKTAGKTVAAHFEQAGFTISHFNMKTAAFVPSLAGSGRIYYYGHFRLDAAELRRRDSDHVIVTMLRDPLDRLLSHYNFSIRVKNNPWRNEILAGMSFVDYAKTFLAPKSAGPQYAFFDDTGTGSFARTGFAPVERCLENLTRKVALFGLVERFEEFPPLLAELLGVRPTMPVLPQNVTRDFADVGVPLKKTITDNEREELERLFADDIFFYRAALAIYDRRFSCRNSSGRSPLRGFA